MCVCVCVCVRAYVMLQHDNKPHIPPPTRPPQREEKLQHCQVVQHSIAHALSCFVAESLPRRCRGEGRQHVTLRQRGACAIDYLMKVKALMRQSEKARALDELMKVKALDETK